MDTNGEIPPEILAKVREISGTPASGKEPAGFSWGALVYGPIYYLKMGDKLFALLSLVASLLVYTVPLLIPMAFFARKRAWKMKAWGSEDVFWEIQKGWDRSAIIGAILVGAILYGVTRYTFSVMSSTFGTTDPNAILQQVQEMSNPQ